jgi:hypothetical protein
LTLQEYWTGKDEIKSVLQLASREVAIEKVGVVLQLSLESKYKQLRSGVLAVNKYMATDGEYLAAAGGGAAAASSQSPVQEPPPATPSLSRPLMGLQAAASSKSPVPEALTPAASPGQSDSRSRLRLPAMPIKSFFL